MSIENENICLFLNANWVPICFKSVKEGILSMCAEPPDREGFTALGIDISFDKNPDGTWDFSKPAYFNPISWSEWEKLPIRDFDEVIHTSKKTFRVPTVLINLGYNQIPKKQPRPTKRAIWERDKGICQFSGQTLTKKTGSVEHLKSKKNGGKDTFTNMVLAHIDINRAKGSKNLDETDLKLIRPPTAPKSIPVCNLITEARHFTWQYFLLK